MSQRKACRRFASANSAVTRNAAAMLRRTQRQRCCAITSGVHRACGGARGSFRACSYLSGGHARSAWRQGSIATKTQNKWQGQTSDHSGKTDGQPGSAHALSGVSGCFDNIDINALRGSMGIHSAHACKCTVHLEINGASGGDTPTGECNCAAAKDIFACLLHTLVIGSSLV